MTEPDGFVGWPKVGAAGTDVDDLNQFYADSLVGEAMVLRPVVLMSSAILKDPALSARYADKARAYLALSEATFTKWRARGAWRRTGDGLITVVLPFGIDAQTGKWTNGYSQRDAPGHGFSHPDNKASLVSLWLVAMSDATGIATVRTYADGWFRTLKSRLADRGETGRLWSYWQPAGAWDYTASGQPKHWIGVHPNDGYYAIDAEAVVAAYEHRLTFTRADLDRLISIGLSNHRIWPALVAYSPDMRRGFEKTLDPDGWAGLYLVPRYLVLQRR